MKTRLSRSSTSPPYPASRPRNHRRHGLLVGVGVASARRHHLGDRRVWLRGRVGQFARESLDDGERALVAAQGTQTLVVWPSDGQQLPVAVSQLPGRMNGIWLTRIVDSQRCQTSAAAVTNSPLAIWPSGLLALRRSRFPGVGLGELTSTCLFDCPKAIWQSDASLQSSYRSRP